MTIKDLATLLKDKGIVGAGGAGFPSYAKLSSKADTVILNCAECEPLLRLHRQLLRLNAYEIISTFDLIAKTVGATKKIIALKESYTGTVTAVKAAIRDFDNFEIKLLPEVYPAGDEVITIYETTGRRVPPGSIPVSVGVTVFNTETVYNIYRAINDGLPVTHKYVTVAGEVKNPKTVYAPVGMSFSELIKEAGGATVKEYELINGGPMMGKLAEESDSVTKTTNAILVLPKEHYVIKRKHTNIQIDMKRAMSACCQCKMCTDLCPRNLLGHPIAPNVFMHAASSGKIQKLRPMLDVTFCSGCGLCEMYACGQGLSPRSMIGEYKNMLREKGIKPPLDAELKDVSKSRNYRRVSKERLTARIGLSKYDVPALIEDEEIKTKTYRISLSQHIGKPATPCVKKGDRVKENQIIGAYVKNELSVNIHSPISGRVESVSDKRIIIKREGDK